MKYGHKKPRVLFVSVFLYYDMFFNANLQILLIFRH